MQQAIATELGEMFPPAEDYRGYLIYPAVDGWEFEDPLSHWTEPRFGRGRSVSDCRRQVDEIEDAAIAGRYPRSWRWLKGFATFTGGLLLGGVIGALLFAEWL